MPEQTGGLSPIRTAHHFNLYLAHSMAIYITDHEVVPCFSKICDWPLNSSRDHFGLHQEKKEKVIMELEVPKRPIFTPTSSTVMVQ